MPTDVIQSALLMGGVGLFCSALLGVAVRFFAVHEDARIAALAALLPNANCGACGLAGCADYARSIVLNAAPVNLCRPGGAEVCRRMAAVMGVEATAMERQVAIVRCGGGNSAAARRFRYNGIADCAAAAAVGGGDKACRYGCLGLGACARVCPVSAIEITADSLAVVHPELCIGCGQCVAACPRALIRLVPETRRLHVLCRSPERGPVVRRQCAVGCIGCTRCAKAAPEAIHMEGALAVVDYRQPLEQTEIVALCPAHTIVERSGRLAPQPAREARA